MIVTLGLAALAALGVAAIDRRRRTRVARDRRRADPARGDRGADSDQPELDRLLAARARAAAGVGRDRSGRAGGLSLRRATAGVGRPHRAAARRAGVRHPLHVLLDAALEAARQRLQRRRAGVDYELLTESLKDVATRPDRAWQAIADSTATHAIVHEASYADGRRPPHQRLAPGARRARSRGLRTDRVFDPQALVPVPTLPAARELMTTRRRSRWKARSTQLLHLLAES